MEFPHLEQIFGALQGAEVRYLLVGGMAVIAHGYLRTTKDIDLVIALESDNLRRAFQALTALGYRPNLPVSALDFVNPETRRRGSEEKGMLVFQMISDRFRYEPLDIFVTEPYDFEREYAKAVWKEVNAEVSIPVIGIARLMAMKRAAARPQDLADVAELLSTHPDAR